METARGVEYGSVVVVEKEVEDDKITLPLKPVIRIATEEDKKKRIFRFQLPALQQLSLIHI